MNERILELVNQADIEFDVSSDNYGVDTATVTPYDLEKFAELLIRECCYVGEQYAEGLFDMEHYDFVNKKIKEHFGVK